MFFWRKKDEGFEWRDYVRTTVLARRANRRQKIEVVKQAAVERARDAGRQSADIGRRFAGVAGDKARAAARWSAQSGASAWDAGRRAGGAGLAAAGRGVRAGLSAAGRGASAGLSGARRGAVDAGARLGLAGTALGRSAGRVFASGAAVSGERLAPAWRAIRDPNISAFLTVVAAGLALACAVRLWFAGPDLAAILSGAAALVAFILSAGPDLWRASGARWPQPMPGFGGVLDGPAVRSVASYGGLAVVAAAVLGAGWWIASRPPGEVASRSSPPPAKSANAIRGRASVLSGDLLRVGGRTVRLSGVEAPERDQECQQANGQDWGCGRAAAQALTRLAGGRSVSCDLSGSDDAGHPLARCRAGDKDIAGALVEKGHVFATPGLLSSYGSLEAKAKSARAGVWKGGAERPAQYRAKLWEEAKRKAPDGCPIKGQASERIYVLPWRPGYDRIKLRPARGDRWFCSESEAQAAGWKAQG